MKQSYKVNLSLSDTLDKLAPHGNVSQPAPDTVERLTPQERAEWLHAHRAPSDWLILTKDEVSTLERELDNMTDQRDAALQALEWSKKSHERELAEAKAEAEKWEGLYDLATDHLSLIQERDNYGPTEELNDTAIRISRELAEAREKLNNNRRMVKEASEALADARKHRDMLAQSLTTYVEGFVMPAEVRKARAALAAVKGGSHEGRGC